MKDDLHCPECGCIISSDLMSADKMRQRFFAILRDIHRNLPPDLLHRFPNAEMLRKHALIAVGWCDVMTVLAGSESAAPGVAKALMVNSRFSIIDINGEVLTMYTARSMSRPALLKKQFLKVSEKALHWIEDQTGIDGHMSEAA